jgi:hypothetical protein
MKEEKLDTQDKSAEQSFPENYSGEDDMAAYEHLQNAYAPVMQDAEF